MTRYGRRFFKLTGSGNDFVFFDARAEPPGDLDRPERMAELCARGTGVGADGIVFLEEASASAPDACFAIRYYNSDGSVALLCGNASLCSVRLAVELGIAPPKTDFEFETGAGRVRGRLGPDGPEIDLQPVAEVQPDFAEQLEPGEHRIGFAMVGVPHLIVRCESIDDVELGRRGRALRHAPALAAGANVNFVARTDEGGWAYRTYERGVEAETLACGTGAVATAALLSAWGEARGATRLVTRSGRPLIVRMTTRANGLTVPTLVGEGRVVYRGELVT